MRRAACATTYRLRATCQGCGRKLERHVHLPLKGVFCAACCPACRAARTAEGGRAKVQGGVLGTGRRGKREKRIHPHYAAGGTNEST